MVRTRTKMINSRESLQREIDGSPEFRDEWGRETVARAVALALVKYRGENGLTQTRLAKQLGMAQGQVGRLELGEHTPTIEMLVRLARGLGQGFTVSVLPPGQEPPSLPAGDQVLNEDVTMSDGIRVVATVGWRGRSPRAGQQ